MKPHERIIVALDVPTATEAIGIISVLKESVGMFKIGLELISSQEAGQVLEYCKYNGVKLFWDNKLCDIPTTVGRTVAAVASKGVHMINVHATCGIEAMAEAVKNKQDSLVLAVTILTSLDSPSLEKLGFNLSGHYTDKDAVENLVCKLVAAAKQAGVDGIICSPADIASLRYNHIDHSGLKFVTPGIRPSWAAANDQKRILTPSDAIKAGADYLVIGRPITNPPDGITMIKAVELIADECDI